MSIGQVRSGREGTHSLIEHFPARAASTHAERAARRQKRCAPAKLGLEQKLRPLSLAEAIPQPTKHAW